MARKKKTVKETILSLIPKLSKYEFEEVAQFVELSHINFHLDNLQIFFFFVILYTILCNSFF